jgi:hypothetical protein
VGGGAAAREVDPVAHVEPPEVADDILVSLFFIRIVAAVAALCPTQRTLEKVGNLLAVGALLIIVNGVIHDTNPDLYKQLNELLATPLGVIGVIGAVWAYMTHEG